MKLLFAAHTFWPEVNGVAEVVRQIATRLAARGHEVHVATRLRRGLRREETVAGVRVKRFAVQGNWLAGVHGEVEQYVAFVADPSWEAIEVHCAQSWPLDALWENIGRIGARTIFVGHGLSELENPAWAPYFELLAPVLRRFDRVVALSPALEEVGFCRAAGLPEAAIVPNAVDLEEWEAAAIGVRESWGIGAGPWLVSVSNHSPVKGHDAFFDVVRRVAESEEAVRGTIIGGPYPADRWGLGALGVRGGCWYSCEARSLFSGRVALRANRPRAEVVSAVKEADIVLVTSSREAAPLVVLEAQAARTPWLAFDVGSIKEDAGGLVVGSPLQMAEQAVALLRDPQRAATIAAKGRAAAVARGGWEAIADRHELLCRQAARSPGGPT